MLRLAEEAGLNHGYLENQLFSTAVQRGRDIVWRRAVPNSGRPYIARAAEEHSGPHEPWFWDGEHYAKQLLDRTRGEVDYARRPAEDWARGLLTLRDPEGNEVVIEATTSWAYVGPGLRITLELLGPEYAMEFNSLATGLKVFLSGSAGEDLVEKQNAEQGLMPVLDDEAGIYGYTLENRHFVERFRAGRAPIETFRDGVAVVEMLMALYRSAELGRTIQLPDRELETYVPPVARPEGGRP
jgi:predicted dehydrogenase